MAENGFRARKEPAISTDAMAVLRTHPPKSPRIICVDVAGRIVASSTQALVSVEDFRSITVQVTASNPFVKILRAEPIIGENRLLVEVPFIGESIAVARIVAKTGGIVFWNPTVQDGIGPESFSSAARDAVALKQLRVASFGEDVVAKLEANDMARDLHGLSRSSA